MTRLKQILIPVAVVATGILGAFATQMSAKSSQLLPVPEMGWIDNPTQCSIQYVCDNEGPFLCTAVIGGVEHLVRGKITPAADCIKPLFQLMPPSAPASSE